jgi:hopanoid biosynthesis associated protein HpnK
MRRLIITADDFGAAPEVNAAVETCHRQGVLSAASLMVAAPAAAAAVALARMMPSLRVGLHLVLVDGRPVSPPGDVPDLVDAAGRFRDDMARAGATMFFNPSARRQLAAEISAQFRAFTATGLPLDHVNAHKHFHLHPTIAGLILKIGSRHGMTAARIPIEPREVLRKVEPGGSYAPSPIIDAWAALARRRFRRAGIAVPDHVFGLKWSGAMTARRLAGLIEQAPDGLSEIYLHPATTGGFPGSAAAYRYAEEMAALIDPQVVKAASAATCLRGGFTDFGSPGGAARLGDDRLERRG